MYQYHMSRDMLPRWVRDNFDVVESVTIGGCNCRTATKGPFAKLKKRAAAHAGTIGIHSIGTASTIGRVKICLARSALWDAGYPTPIFLHEVAHGLAAYTWASNGRHIGHGKKWRRTFQGLLDRWHQGKYIVHNSTYWTMARYNAWKQAKKEPALQSIVLKFKLILIRPGYYKYGGKQIFLDRGYWWTPTPSGGLGKFASITEATRFVDLC